MGDATTAAAGDHRPTVVFDLGGVLIDWDPRRLYRSMLPDDAAVEAFLAEVGFAEWNAAQDAGRPFTEAVAELSERFPHHAELISAYPQRFAETLVGEVGGTVAVLEELDAQGARLLALTNWSAETFVHGRSRFAFLDRFEGIVVSGELGVAKPDPRIFAHLLERYAVRAQEAVFIDDVPANVEAALRAGLDALVFHDAAQLRAELVRRGLLAPGA